MSTAGDIAHSHHAIDYIEIAVTDIDAAKAFYATRSAGRSSTTALTTPASRARARKWAACDSIPRSAPAGRW